MNEIGTQVDGKTLYEHQKVARNAPARVLGPAIVALNLQVPENVGSVLRLADAAACRQVVFVGTNELNLQKIHKTARNCESLVSWSALSMNEFMRTLDSLRPLIALEITTGSRDLFSAQLPDACTIVIGSERHGIPDNILQLCDLAVHIPMFGVNGSMNVTHALAIALFEWRRQHAGQMLPE